MRAAEQASPRGNVMLPVRILGTASVLPGRAVTTAELAREVGREPETIEQKTGIRTRYWAPPGTLMADLGAQALRLALEQAGLAATELRRILFVSSSGGDTLVPATANRVAAALGLSGSCDAFDLNNACMGFLSAFDVAARSVATGLGPVGIVTVEYNSRALSPSEPRPYLIFGDVAAAAVLAPGTRPGEGVLAAAFGNDGSHPPDTVLEHPLRTGRLEGVRFHTPSRDMLRVVFEALDRATSRVLEHAGIPLGDIQWVLPHQPNGTMLRDIIERYAIEPARLVPVVEEIGSVAAASIPFSLDRLLRTRPVRPGDRILMLGVGAGVSYGAILYQVGG
ncbi:3-oxoacyl-(acyl-carrier-protein) synthase III [Archangium gephyra]|uniref:3-oxoacyl-(Acyl-carrier-protein) synthase III n=2 Tax=Archangium gephyra TaxID=48 RepID=A0AAC8QE16_9BACT|nr:3-oxoacyl-[acyl-carrier-protein] synthase, KASIII [Archangium gephyra]REG36212.1 3-oxoacyl-(acyl-carrier-protein) synthase III [Archangium gephyra]